MYSICTVTDDAECKNGFVINSTCYVVSQHELVYWFTAVNRCLSKGGSLAVFDDYVRGYINKTLIPGGSSFTASLWIGLVKSWWTWSGIVRYDLN